MDKNRTLSRIDFTLILQSTLQLVCHFVQVDLAGSENVGRSGAVDKRLREAGRKLFYQDFMNSLLIYLIFHHITQRAAVKEIESLRQKTETTLGM